MEVKINLPYFDFDNIELETNSINLIVGKNNIGKTNLLKEIQKYFSKEKKNEIETYFLDLNLNPFESLKEESDFNKKKESMNSTSYFLIKDEFEKNFNSDALLNHISNLLSEKMEFEKNKINLEKKLNFQDLGLSLEINNSQISTLLKKPLTIKGISHFNDQIHEIADMGLGHLRIAMLKMLTYILEKSNNKKQFVLLVDEPEAFLHPNLIKEACIMLKELSEKYKITIILITHSPYVISELKEYFLNIRILHREPKNKKINISQKLTQKYVLEEFNTIYYDLYDEKNLDLDNYKISKIKSILNFDFVRMFFSNKILAVEGISDYFVFTFPNIFKKIKEKFGDFEVIPFYGLNNLSLAYTIFQIFKKDFIFICDNDAKAQKKPTNKNTQRLLELQKKGYERIKILESGELEDELNINKAANSSSNINNEKPSNIINQKDKIDTETNAALLIKYLDCWVKS